MTVAPADFSLLERFHAHLADERRLSPNTVQAYRRDLEQLVTFLGRAHGSLASATHDDLRRFLAQQTTRGYARASIARRVGAIRTFYRWASTRGHVPTDPAELLGRPKVVSRLPSVLRPRDAAALFASLVRAQPAPYAAFVDTGDIAVCSVSPELFFTLDAGVITSRPMKGTAPRGRFAEEDAAHASQLAQSEKNRAENVMIVDMMRNDLGRIAETGTVEVPELLAVERYPTVWQMTSTVTARTTASLANIFAASCIVWNCRMLSSKS